MSTTSTTWTFLDSARAPNGGELLFYRRGEEFSIRVSGTELMNSRQHGSEEALAEIAWEYLAGREQPHFLIGGLGMGYTLSAALKVLPGDARVTVAELVPSVVQWNREHMGHLAGHPLQDARVEVQVTDVARVIKKEVKAFDAILLDVDNGPNGLTKRSNNWLYSENGLSTAYFALRPGGMLAVWSSGPDKTFTERLHKIGYEVDVIPVRARKTRGEMHTIWLARRDDPAKLRRA